MELILCFHWSISISLSLSVSLRVLQLINQNLATLHADKSPNTENLLQHNMKTPYCTFNCNIRPTLSQPKDNVEIIHRTYRPWKGARPSNEI